MPPSVFNEHHHFLQDTAKEVGKEVEEEEEVCLSAWPLAELLSGGEEKACLRSRLCLPKRRRTIVFMCQRVWQRLQTEGGLRWAAQ